MLDGILSREREMMQLPIRSLPAPNSGAEIPELWISLLQIERFRTMAADITFPMKEVWGQESVSSFCRSDRVFFPFMGGQNMDVYAIRTKQGAADEF